MLDAQSARVAVIGGTGLLGSAAALALASRGHEVTLMSRRPSPVEELAKFRRAPLDLDRPATFAAIAGHDVVVLASGPDDRAPYPRPATEYLRDHLVAPSRALAQACVETGVRGLVVIGSYFSAFARENPDLHLAERHPYVRARLDQEAAIQVSGLATVILDIPYVFGTGVTGYPSWIDVVARTVVGPTPYVAFPAGSTTATTVAQVGDAVARAAELTVAGGGGTWPVGERAITWSEMFHELGEGMGRRLVHVPVPRSLVEPAAWTLAWRARRRRAYLGVSPRYVMEDLVARDVVVDLEPGRSALGWSPVDLDAGVRATGRAYARR